MEIRTIKIDKLQSGPSIKNPDIELKAKMKTSILRHGQLSLVHVWEDPIRECYTVVAGNKLVDSMRELGVVDVHCLVHTNYQDALLCALEVDCMRFKIDPFKLVDILKTIETPARRLQHSLPWTEQEIKNMITMSEFDWDKFGEPDENPNQLSLL